MQWWMWWCLWTAVVVVLFIVLAAFAAWYWSLLKALFREAAAVMPMLERLLNANAEASPELIQQRREWSAARARKSYHRHAHPQRWHAGSVKPQQSAQGTTTKGTTYVR